MTDIDPRIAMLFITTGMRVLATRVLVGLALMMTFALFAVALWLPTWERIAAGALFALLVLWPITRLDRKMSADRALVAPEGE